LHQLETTKTALILVYADFLPTALSAAKLAGISENCIVVIEPSAASPFNGKHQTLSKLVSFGSSKPQNFVERKLRPGEAKTKVAFYSFSSGTTGMCCRPRCMVLCLFLLDRETEGRCTESRPSRLEVNCFQAVIIPHYAFIANVLQKCAHYGISDPSLKKKHMNPGDVAVAGVQFPCFKKIIV
jgi:hypothetical protein